MKDTQLPKWYRHITDLPLRAYIDCHVNNNLSALVISGYPSPDQLEAAWLDIQNQYSEFTGGNENLMYKILLREVGVLSARWQQIQEGLKILKLVYVPHVAADINKILSTNFPFNKEDIAGYQNDIKRAGNRSKSIKIQLDLKTKALESMQGKFEKGEKPGIEYYHRVLIMLSNHAGYNITMDITTYEYCERIKQYNNYCEQLKAVKNGRK